MPLPSEKKWGPEMWTENYRDKNRIETHESGTAPCKTACPAHIAVQGYLKLAAQGRYTDALELIKKNNPLPAICGHVCNRRCEDACTRATIDEAIAIDEVKKFIAMQDLKAETRFIPKKVVPTLDGEFKQKIAIVGGGPSGISCAFYLAEKGYKPTIFEKNEKLGGMVVYGIPSFVLEKDIVAAEIDILREMGVEFKTGVEVGKDITLNQLREDGYEAFYIAIGCQGGRKINVPGEDADGVMTGVDFLHITTDDENYKLAGDTVVIGGGNVAMDCARTIKRLGAQEVKVIYRRAEEQMPAEAKEIEEAKQEGIKFLFQNNIVKIIGNQKVEKLELIKTELVQKEGEKRKVPINIENSNYLIDIDYVIMALGSMPEKFTNDLELDLDKYGYIIVDEKNRTSKAKIFAGGDIAGCKGTVAWADRSGRDAANSIDEYLKNI